MERNNDEEIECIDITACKGEGCPVRDNCYRYIAIMGGWNEWQTIFTSCPYDKGTKKCSYFWKM
jgi:hypothetical protein